jgi:hypothetical protein
MRMPRRLTEKDAPDLARAQDETIKVLEDYRREAVDWVRTLDRALLALRQRRGDPFKKDVTEDDLELLMEARLQNLGVKGMVLWLLEKRKWRRGALANFVVEAMRGERDTTYDSVYVTIGTCLRNGTMHKEYIDGVEWLSCPTTK